MNTFGKKVNYPQRLLKELTPTNFNHVPLCVMYYVLNSIIVIEHI